MIDIATSIRHRATAAVVAFGGLTLLGCPPPDTACGERACPVGGQPVEYQQARQGVDISGGYGIATQNASGSFATYGTGTCRYQCLFPTCQPGQAARITANTFQCSSPCESQSCPPGCRQVMSSATNVDGAAGQSASGVRFQKGSGECSVTCECPSCPAGTAPQVRADGVTCQVLACPEGTRMGASGTCEPLPDCGGSGQRCCEGSTCTGGLRCAAAEPPEKKVGGGSHRVDGGVAGATKDHVFGSASCGVGVTRTRFATTAQDKAGAGSCDAGAWLDPNNPADCRVTVRFSAPMLGFVQCGVEIFGRAAAPPPSCQP